MSSEVFVSPDPYQKLEFTPIGIVRTAFKRKFGVARQSLMVKQATGILKLNDDQNLKLACKDLEKFSHLWIIFVFHHHLGVWRPMINPPRLDVKEKVGVLSSRSPYRPNPIGMSVVKLDRIDLSAKGGVEIHLSGVDLLDETPVLDIKPYLPYADRVDDANSGWAETEIKKYPVVFADLALQKIESIQRKHPDFKELLIQMIELDPRPRALRKCYPIERPSSEGRKFGFCLLEFEIKCEIHDQAMHIVNIIDRPL